MIHMTRRTFTTSGAVAAAALFVGRRLSAQAATALVADLVTTVPELANIALDVARRAGATYADVHVRVAQLERFGFVYNLEPNKNPSYTVQLGFGVRALVNGYWGYAGMDGPMTTDLAAQAGSDAAGQANAAAAGKPRVVELASAPVVQGTWTMPVEIDPFTVSYEEKYDTMAGMNDYVLRLRNVQASMEVRPRAQGLSGGLDAQFAKEVRTFASTDGSLTTQTVYDTSIDFQVGTTPDWMTESHVERSTGLYSVAGAGWEYVRSAPYRDIVARMLDEALRARHSKPLDVGRYDIVFDAQAMAGMLDRTIGVATALDRAMGDDANDGTSFLDAPLDMLGTYQIGSPLLTVTTDRAMPGGAATVQWDDEGVVPSATPLVTNGILTDFQTTRESASWLAPYYRRVGRTLRSNGCACAQGTEPVRQRSPNLIMQPGQESLSFDDLVKSTTSGIAVLGGGGSTDFQALNGMANGELLFEIRNGQLGRSLTGGTLSYRTPEFWRNLVAVGGPASAHAYGFVREIPGRVAHSISAVPAKVNGVNVIDAGRRA